MSLEKGENSKSDVIRKVERLVCDCVNEAFTSITMDRYTPVSVSTLYEGVTNTPLTRRIARSALFVLLHDRFGINYTDLSEHSHLTSNSVMTAVRKYKNTPESDDIVRKVNELIEIELQKFPIV